MANAEASVVIDAVATQTIKFKDKSGGDYAYTDDGEKIKFYQISLKSGQNSWKSAFWTPKNHAFL